MQIALASGTLVASISDAGPGSDINDHGDPTYVLKAGAAAWTEVQPAVRLSDHIDMVSLRVCGCLLSWTCLSAHCIQPAPALCLKTPAEKVFDGDHEARSLHCR